MFKCEPVGRVLRPRTAMMDSGLRLLQPRIEALKVLIVDDDQYMRKVVRTMLNAIGVKTVYEAADGAAGLEALRTQNPDLVIVDWEMPTMDGAQFVRMVRSPGEFPVPDVPIIMLSGHGDRWRVVEAARLGAHEYLLKPVSTKALQDRIVAVLGRPRPTVQMEGYYGPAPRRLVVLEAEQAAEDAASAKPSQTVQPPVQQPAAARAIASPSPAAKFAAEPAVQKPAITPRSAARPAVRGQSSLGRRTTNFLSWR